MKFLLLSLFAIATMSTTLHDYNVTSIDGSTIALSEYKGKVVMVVNVASFCGYTRQYEPLEKLYDKYKDKGLVVLGLPANDFGAQEPGTNAEIKQFCSAKFGVSFPMTEKISVKGAAKAPIYQFLTSGGGNEAFAGEIGWNFEKFLIGKDGSIIARYKSSVDPMAANVIADIEKALAQ